MITILAILEGVRKILVSELKITDQQVDLDSNISADLGADSLQTMEIVTALEDKFTVSISDDVADRFKTVRDIVWEIECLTRG